MLLLLLSSETNVISHSLMSDKFSIVVVFVSCCFLIDQIFYFPKCCIVLLLPEMSNCNEGITAKIEFSEKEMNL